MYGKIGIAQHYNYTHDGEFSWDGLVLDEIVELEEELGRTPTRREFEEMASFSCKTLEKYYGSWNNSLRKAGLERNITYDYSEDDLEEEFHRLAEELGRAPKIKEMDETGKYSHKVYTDKYGSWNSTVEYFGYEVNKNRGIDVSDISEDIKRVEEIVEKPPSAREMNKYGEHSVSSAIKLFGSWQKAVKESVGQTRWEWISENTESHARRKLEKWADSVKERDDYSCRQCGCGEYVEAHHIIPKSMNTEMVYDKGNGISLCTDCHASAHEGNVEENLIRSNPERVNTK